jgi:hypothetical protein
LTPWRRRWTGFALPVSKTRSIWSERWVAPTDRLAQLASSLRSRGARVTTAGGFDRWDLAVRVGPLGSARLRLVAEEHGHGRQMIRFRIWPRWSRGGAAMSALFAVFAATAVRRDAGEPAVVFAALAFVIAAWMVFECAASVAICLSALRLQPDRRHESVVLSGQLLDQVIVAKRQSGRSPIPGDGEVGEHM